MQYSFAKRVSDVPNAGIAAMMRYASSYTDVISLGQGTPQFPTPQFIYEELYQRSKTDQTLGMYSSVEIEKPLLSLIVERMEKDYGFMPQPEQLYLTTGGIGGLFSAFMVLLEAGEEIIYFDPGYPLHLSQIHLTQAKPVFVSLQEENGWKLDFAALEKAITKRTKVIILTNPNNPTGTILSEAEVRKLAEIVLTNHLLLIVDEAYGFLTYENDFFSPLQIPQLRDNCILCKSFSKEYAMTGWRIGFVYANAALIDKIRDVHTYFCISPTTISVVAATIALQDRRGEQAQKEFIAEFTLSRETICRRLDRLPKLFAYQKPEGAYYVFPKILYPNLSAFEFAKLLVDEAKVITIPGDSMGPSGTDHLRLSFAAKPDLIDQAFDRIDGFAQKHGYLQRL